MNDGNHDAEPAELNSDHEQDFDEDDEVETSDVLTSSDDDEGVVEEAVVIVAEEPRPEPAAKKAAKKSPAKTAAKKAPAKTTAAKEAPAKAAAKKAPAKKAAVKKAAAKKVVARKAAKPRNRAGSPPRQVCAIAAGVREFGRAVDDPEGVFGIAQWSPGSKGKGPARRGRFRRRLCRGPCRARRRTTRRFRPPREQLSLLTARG